MLHNTKLYFAFGKQSWFATRSIGSFANSKLYDESVSHICSDKKTLNFINQEGEVGIDFGTTNTRVAVNDGKGYKFLEQIPSVVHMENHNEPIIGNKQHMYLEKSFHDVKRLMFSDINKEYIQEYMKTVPISVRLEFDKHPYMEVGGYGCEQYKPYELAALLLNYMKKSAEWHFKEEINNAVVTVPTACHNYEDYKKAGQLAGFDQIDLVKEPIAAVLALDSLDPQESTSGDKVTAVYDFGGGKFEVSIIKSNNGHMDLHSHCDLLLNGNLIDNALINYFILKFYEEYGFNLRNDKALLKLRKEAVDAKIKLFSEAEVKIDIQNVTPDFNDQSYNLNFELTRKVFENVTDDLLKRTIPLCETTMKSCGIEKKDIDEVLLVGGVTKMPKVKEMVEEIFGKAPNNKLDPEEILAIGAAATARRVKQYIG